MNKNIIIILASFVLLFSACLKDKELFEQYPNVPSAWTSQQKAQLNLSGEIIDEKGKPVADAVVNVGGSETKTDKRGFFILQKVSDTPDRVYVQVNKTGFFKGSRVFRASAKADNYVKIMLLEKKRILSFDSKLGSDVKVGKANIKLPKNGFKTALGTPYNGIVTVEAKYLDPSKSETFLQMPGNLQGVNFKGEEQILGTYGMVVCELTDNSGNPINLNGDSTATITYPITSKFQTSQPLDVPLWYFDEKIGAWREEGNSTLVGNTYVGKVKHFSFWNCDYPFSSVKFETTIKDTKGNPMKGLMVLLCFKTDKDSLGVSSGAGWTDSLGWVGGMIPKNQVFTLKIIDPNCNNIIYTQQIGPFDKDVVLPTITLNLPTLQTVFVNIKGKVNDCNGNPVKKGYVYATGFLKNGTVFSNKTIVVDSSGNYDATLINSFCYSSADIDNVTIVGIDYASAKESTVQTFPLVQGNNNLGTLNLCNNYSEFLNLNVNGKDHVFAKPLAEGNLYIQAQKDSSVTNPGGDFFYIQILLGNSQTTGTYQAIIGSTIQLGGMPLVFKTSSKTIPVEITKYANAIGDYYEGIINSASPLVVLKDASGTDYTFKGTFKAKRRF
jgi:hypothetical protein